MSKDMLTVMWKEAKGMFRQGKSRSRAIFTLVVPVLFLGIILPIQLQDEWLNSAWSVILALFAPLVLIAPTICDSFAGERERHTLETLLASRLSDRAILFGKMLFSLAYGWGMTVFLMLLSLVVANLCIRSGVFQFYRTDILLIDLGFSLLLAGFVASLGILISLRAATAQSAAQMLMMAVFIPVFGLQAVVFLLPTFLPGQSIEEFLGKLDFNQIMLILMGVLLLADSSLLLAAMSRFKRSRMIFS